jgi:putative transcriptional regulator
MIKFHPSDDILEQYAAAELPVSVAVAVAIHVEMCACCQDKVNAKQAKQAESIFESESAIEAGTIDFDDMLSAITVDDTLDVVTAQPKQNVLLDENSITLPSALSNLDVSHWQRVGKLARSRVALDDGALRSSMLQIDAGGQVPHHTHNGFEITLLLDGSFSDEMGTYNKGDFIWLNGEHNHQPETIEGCLCYTVVSDALHFNHGVSRLLNPIGKLIY